ncbi:major facilitator superfamily protein [Kipferlia bialata]|uniref:Major facilitator superfamily protein n=1 Tax=Kipferlia bialata TaxID=797122 RepID=A0A9K3CY86_9EUKA|nr:major facilitator superfamily protein [Kipferlia bialata]|eukprot:g5900.t1
MDNEKSKGDLLTVQLLVLSDTPEVEKAQGKRERERERSALMARQKKVVHYDEPFLHEPFLVTMHDNPQRLLNTSVYGLVLMLSLLGVMLPHMFIKFTLSASLTYTVPLLYKTSIAFALPLLLVIPFTGSAVDKRGRKGSMITGLCGASVSWLLLALSYRDTDGLLIVSRVCSGFFSGMVIVSSYAALLDCIGFAPLNLVWVEAGVVSTLCLGYPLGSLYVRLLPWFAGLLGNDNPTGTSTGMVPWAYPLVLCGVSCAVLTALGALAVLCLCSETASGEILKVKSSALRLLEGAAKLTKKEKMRRHGIRRHITYQQGLFGLYSFYATSTLKAIKGLLHKQNDYLTTLALSLTTWLGLGVLCATIAGSYLPILPETYQVLISALVTGLAPLGLYRVFGPLSLSDCWMRLSVTVGGGLAACGCAGLHFLPPGVNTYMLPQLMYAAYVMGMSLLTPPLMAHSVIFVNQGWRGISTALILLCRGSGLAVGAALAIRMQYLYSTTPLLIVALVIMLSSLIGLQAKGKVLMSETCTEWETVSGTDEQV